MTHLVIGGMRERGFGRIINLSSVNAEGQMGQTNYAASKAAIEGFTNSLAIESKPKGITVNTVRPGYTRTDMLSTVSDEILNGIVAKIPSNVLESLKKSPAWLCI